MPYIGNNLATQFQAFATQTITGDGSTGYTLDKAVANGKELLVYINNVKQEEGSGKSYTASGTTITFSEAVTSGDSCYLVYLGSAVQTVTPPDASVSSSKLVSGFPSASLDMNGNELILDADADTSITADTDDQIDIRIGGSDKITINSSGRVGIGTTDIDAPLDIVDSGTKYIRVSDTAADATNKVGGLAIRHKTNSEEDFNIINGVCGGSSNIVNIGGSDFIGNLNCATQIAFFTGANQTTLNGTSRMTIDSIGSLNVQGVYDDTTSSSANVNVHSDGHIRRSTSSRRYKNTITDATHGLTELLNLRSVTFKGNNDGDTIFGGLIAEEVHDAGLTEFVVYDDQNRPDALSYGNMVALCIKAIQELKTELDNAKARITALESK